MKTRKTISLLVLILALAITFAACSNKSGEPAVADDPKKNDVVDETFVLKMATPSNPEDNCVKAFYKFEEMVEKQSNGRISVEVFDRGQLGSHSDYIDSLSMGNIQAAEINTSVLSSVSKSFQVFDLPYISKGMDHLMEVIYDDGLGEKLSKQLEEETGIKIIGWMVRTPRSVYSSKGEIHTASDFKGLKIRVMESPIMTKTFELLGAVPVPLAATERYMALQTGVVDAAENSVPLIITEKEYEVTSYVNLTEHFCTPNIIAMDVNFYNKLPEDLQKIVSESALEAGKYASELDKASLETALEELQKYGMTITKIDDKSTFIEAVTPLYEKYAGEIGQDILDMFLK